MKRRGFKISNLPIASQLLLFIVPMLIFIISLSFYVQYKDALTSLYKQEEQRKLNIKEGCKLFIDNYDLSLQLIEKELEDRLSYLSQQILENYSSNLVTANLDSLSELLSMQKENEDIYIINREGIVINTTRDIDLGLNFYSFGESYKIFLKDVWLKKNLVIERVALESKTNTPKKYAYQAINNNYILEIGIRFSSIDKAIKNFTEKTQLFADRYSNIRGIDLFAATEFLPPRTIGAKMEEAVKPIAIRCFKSKRDTSFYIDENKGVKNDLIYLEMRSGHYFKGYVLQIISDSSLKRVHFFSLLKKTIFTFLLTMVLIVGVFYFLNDRITQPLRHMVKQVSRVDMGEDIPRITTKGNAEIKILAKEFNAKASKINKYRATLEKKVEERTIQLSDKNEALKKLLNERGELIAEIHHRVKNNLQIISSLLNLQAKKLKSSEAIEAFENSKKRVIAMGVLHDQLSGDEIFSEIKASNYLDGLLTTLKGTLADNISISIKANEVMFTSADATAIGLIINEATTNALKHGFDEKIGGKIEVETNYIKSNIILTIFNNGKKLPEDYNLEGSGSLGMLIISAFVDKLDGAFEFKNVSGGVALSIVFPQKRM